MWRRCAPHLEGLGAAAGLGVWRGMLAGWKAENPFEVVCSRGQDSVERVDAPRMLSRDVFASQFLPKPLLPFVQVPARSFTSQTPKDQNDEKDGKQMDGESRTQCTNDEFCTQDWFRKEILQAPNALSLSRMCAGPVVAYWIVSSQWQLAVVGLALAGVTDWLDGYVAKKQGQQSVLGSYLDPFADKVLIACAVGALVYRGSLPLWVAGTVVARDIFLICATFLHHSRNSRGTGWQLLEYIRQAKESELVQPFFISKVNTTVQLVLVSGCMAQGWLGWPGENIIMILSQVTVGTTLMSWAAYVHAYFAGTRAIP